ncbi:MAG: pyridoxal phosphate-dependent aminotransferase [Ruminococcus sp.]
MAEYENTKPDQVICGNGAAEVIFSLCRAVNPRRALVPAPTFAEYQQALYSVDCQVEFFLLDGKKGFVLEENFLQALTEEIDIIFLCNPNNPTGLLVEKPLLEKILKRCQELNILMAVDECFLDFVPSPEKYTLKEYLETYDNLFLLKAFTKRYAMAGVRLGYGLCGNKGLLEKMEGVCQPWNVSSMAQAAGLAALQEREYVEKGRQVIFQELAYLKEELTALGYPVYPSRANYVFFTGPADLYEKLEQKKILIRDCSNYTGLSKGYYRVAVKKHEENQQLVGH